MSEIDSLMLEKDLEKILSKIPDLIQYQQFYEKAKYLRSLKDKDNHEDFFFEIY